MLLSKNLIKMNKLKYSLIIALLLLGFGCSDDFLDHDPIAADTDASYYTTYDALNTTATAAYGILCSLYTFDIYYAIGFQSMSDDVEVGGENTSDWPAFQHFDRCIHTADETEVADYWAYCYKGIRLCNTVLYYADGIKETIISQKGEEEAASTVALIDDRIAEMKFLRAWYHFALMQVYGGVPIIDYIVSSTDVARSDIGDVLHFIENDLEEAIPYLSEKSVNSASDEIGRASVGAAKALLAKAYLYESSYAENYAGDYRFGDCSNQYAKALSYAEEVMNSGEYELVGINGERYDSWRAPAGKKVGGFQWMFTLDGENSDESVWAIQNVQDGAGWTYTRGNYYTTYVTIRYVYKKMLDETPGDIQIGGWSFNIPSYYLIEAFGNNDSREDNLNSVGMDATLDPRYKATIGTGRETVISGTDTTTVAGDSIYTNYDGVDGWYEMCFDNLPVPAISRKYELSPDDGWTFGSGDTYGEGPLNNKLIRYADVVLIAAEAAYKTGDESKALNYVNMVRTRARLSGETGYPANLSAISFEDIVHERRLEFAMENQRIFDLTRWGLGYKFINGIYIESLGETPITYEVGKHEFFPIPNEEIQKTTGGLENYDVW